MKDVSAYVLEYSYKTLKICEQHYLDLFSSRNPWFDEFWEDTFACKLERNFPLVFKPGENDKVCNESSRLSDKVGYEQESKIQFVVDAVYAFAHALHKLHTDVCVNKDRTKHGKSSVQKEPSMMNNRRYQKGNNDSRISRLTKADASSLDAQPGARQQPNNFPFPSSLAKDNYANRNGAASTKYDIENQLNEPYDETAEEEPIKYVCPEMANYDGKDFYNNYLLNVSFIGEFLHDQIIHLLDTHRHTTIHLVHLFFV